MRKVKSYDADVRKAGPLVETWIERHRRWADCKCEMVEKKASWPPTYVCLKCGREI